MKLYSKVQSTVKPKGIVIDNDNIWVYSNIKRISNEDTEIAFIGFEFDIKQYSKDEFILLKLEEQKSLLDRINNTQLALCELYEAMEGKE